ncbi:MAG: hypothetical protein KJ571_01555 [Bacteroidetes bacterium]|nr:hypothetical protein [Bacteroidota bacterium]
MNKKILLVTALFITFSTLLSSEICGQTNLNGNNQFIYKLKLIPSLLDENNWTERENNIVKIHFERLKELTEKGTVIIAGRTINSDESQFGIVIFEAANIKEAEIFMNEDPAVKEKIMSAELFPFRVALMRN